MDEIQELIQIANDGKNEGYYAPANIVFVVLLLRYLANEAGLVLKVETNDPEGANPSEAYYDLLVLCYGEHEICIPVTLIERTLLFTAMKTKPQCVARRNHRRQVSVGEPAREICRQERICELLGENLIRYAVDRIESPMKSVRSHGY
ncbi:MAG: hypothetical protein WAN50_00995 [Minisyncoccia bacterium]